MDFTDKKRVKHPQINANPVSRLFYLWIFPLFHKGSKGDLTIDDLYDRLPEDDSGTLGYSLEKKWDQEKIYAKSRGKKPSFIRMIRKVIGVRFMILGLFVAFDELALKIGQTLIIRRLINSFSEDAKLEKDILFQQYVNTSCLILITWMHSITFHKIVVHIMHLAMKCRVATSSMMYRKILRLSKTVQSEHANIGKLINMLSSDVNCFENLFFHFHQIFVAPLQLIVLTFLLYTELGVSCFAGIGMILVGLIPVQVIVGRLTLKYRTQIAKRSDERGRIMNEIIMGVRIIKMYAWEKPFSVVINKLRKLEVMTIRKAAYLRCAFLSLTHLSRVTVPFCTFIVYVSLGNVLTAEKVYFTLSVYSIMLQGMVQKIPVAVSQFGEFIVAIRRIETLLLLDEQTEAIYLGKDISPSDENKNNEFIKITPQASIQIQSVIAMWTDQRKTLEHISLDVAGNELVIIVGPVGSGKSSLLNLLISELPVSSGSLKITGKISYVSQESWIFSSDIRQNILFGSIYDEARYNKIIQVCALEDDLNQFPDGDQTIVGERGVSLSGGQKARVNLARALYKKADIYLLDDPLSAVDSRVSRHLFEKCIKEYLDGTLRILVTHQLQYLNQADHIVVLNEQGQILSQGKYESLVAEGIDFVGLLANPASESAETKSKIDSREGSESEDNASAAVPSDVIKQKPKLKAETMLRGSVTLKTYLEYFRSGNSRMELIFIVICYLSAQGIVSFTDVWLSAWTNEVSRRSLPPSSTKPPSNNHGLSGFSDRTYIIVYTAAVISVIGVISLRAVSFFHYCMSISVNLHNRMFACLVRAPVKFFDDNPSGRIMNRFAKDLNSVDEKLPMAFFDFINVLLFMIGIIVVVIISNYYIAAPSAVLIFGLWWMRGFYVKTARDLKRLESIAKSPSFLHLSATTEGLTTIRALGVQEKLIDQFDSIQNIHSSAYYLIMVSNRWFGIWLDLLCLFFLIFVAFSFLVLSSSTEVGNVGLAITLALNLMGTSQWGMRSSAETENYMTSVERALEYCRIPSEAALDSDKEKKPPKSWPSEGTIKFCDVKLSYNDPPNENDVLKGLTFEIKGNEKIGIVGRTGAGKSSILVALFRLTESSGDILIDDVSIKQVGLHDLRKSISIIPQDPVLFSGTLRYNLDPFEQFLDNELWQVLKEVNLGDAVPSLDFKVSDGGGNFSVGQKQLICLARAILRKNKIIVMDEATANVDPSTDNLIQTKIRQKFAHCTIITIAHRLNSVIDNDRILVLENGYLKEFDTPENLLNNSTGIFTSMVQQSGANGVADFTKLATSEKDS